MALARSDGIAVRGAEELTAVDASDDAAANVRPDARTEIRLTGLSATRGANYWSRSPVTRLDLVIGAYDDVSSTDVGDFTDRLVGALPGLEEHRCSIGERGGFITRLNRGTYAPHIIEHVALELQSLIGHEVGYGRSRGGDMPGEYTVVFEHQHEATGLRAAALALDIVQQTFAGTLGTIEHALAELRGIAATGDVPPITPHVLCGVTGGGARVELRAEIARRIGSEEQLIVDVSPGYVLQAGLSYARSDVAVVADTDLTDVPPRYRERERAERLAGVVVDALPRGGVLVAPAKAWELQDMARSARAGVAVFSGTDDVTPRDKKVARSAAWMRDGRVMIEHRGRIVADEPLAGDAPAVIQVAAALTKFVIDGTPDAARRGDGRPA